MLDQSDTTNPRSRQFIYNQANRFAEYIEDGQTIASYTYNVVGQRTRKELESETKLFHYDTGIQLLTETDEVGNPKRDYLWLGTRPIAQLDSTRLITYLHIDHLLTPRVGTSDAQKIVWQWEGEAFGDARASGSMQVRLGFPGHYFDSETGQHYNNFRDYASSLGRYVQSDPIGLEGGKNQYSYALENPLRFVDPLGLDVRCPPGQRAVPFPGQEDRFPAIFDCRPSTGAPTHPQCPFGNCAAFNETNNSQCGITCDDSKLSACLVLAVGGASPSCVRAVKSGLANSFSNFKCLDELSKANECISKFCRLDDCCG